MSPHICARESMYPIRSEVLNPLELELPVFKTHSTWVLGTKLGSFAKPVCVLNCWWHRPLTSALKGRGRWISGSLRSAWPITWRVPGQLGLHIKSQNKQTNRKTYRSLGGGRLDIWHRDRVLVRDGMSKALDHPTPNRRGRGECGLWIVH